MTLREKRAKWKANTQRYRVRHADRVRLNQRKRYSRIKQAAYQATYAKKHPGRVKRLTAARVQRRKIKGLVYANKRGAERSAFLAAYKMQRGCKDCGFAEHPAALDFDHLRDKVQDIASLRTCSMERLLAEIAKCEVVCANHHRIRTARRRQKCL